MKFRVSEYYWSQGQGQGLATPSCPTTAPNQAVICSASLQRGHTDPDIVSRLASEESLHGAIATSKEVRVLSTDVLWRFGWKTDQRSRKR